MPNLGKADANASRAFFVRMLTRDISLEDCILDLIDNSVDSAWKALGKKRLSLKNGPDFSNSKIELKFDTKKFSLRDNCGGMSLESAKRYAFTFGRKDVDPEDSAEFSIGVYGIGLKRAIFKLGTKIDVRSSHKSSTGADNFVVPIDVTTWVKGKETDWDFPIQESQPLPEPGVSIEISTLTDQTASAFENPEFEKELRRTIARDYALHLHRGLIVLINGTPVTGEVFKLFSSDEFEPLNFSYEETVGGAKIHVEVVAGQAFPPPDDNEPSERRGEREEKSGWYVACNGRIVMAADKSMLSVWGDDFPAWHPQYTGFFGLIIFTSDQTELLPLTTTKRSVDPSSAVYRKARPRMKEPTRAWISYTNVKKTDKEAAKAAESKAVQTSIFSLPRNQLVALPKIVKVSRQRETSIQFLMPTVRVKNLAKGFGDSRMSNSEVGRRAFEYAYEDVVEE
jgi:Histidine kinase-, DNA gyrase B-, and HSP90-like ATPase